MNQRIEYIDAMRGLAMMMVVISHCCTWIFGNHPFFNLYINHAIQIPLFFFISGFFAPKLTNKPFYQVTTDKLIHLVIPALLVLFIFCWIFQLNYLSILHEQLKGGYWFTLVLFVFIIIYISIDKAIRFAGISGLKANFVHIILGLVVSYSALFFSKYAKTCSLINLFSVTEYFSYTYFVVGAVLFEHRDTVFKLQRNAILSGLCILFYFLAQIATALYGTESLQLGAGIFLLCMHTSSLLIIWQLFHRYPALSTDSRIGRFLSLVGRRSLDIYFIHYFFLPDLHLWGNYLFSINAQFIEYLLAIMLAIPITFISLGMGYILRLSPVTARLLLGVKPSK